MLLFLFLEHVLILLFLFPQRRLLLVKERVDARDEDDGEERCDEDKNVIASFSLSLSYSLSLSLSLPLTVEGKERDFLSKQQKQQNNSGMHRQFFRWRVFVKSREWR